MVPVLGTMARYLVKDCFDNYAKIDKISSPILFIHGTKDSIVNYKHSQELFGNFLY